MRTISIVRGRRPRIGGSLARRAFAGLGTALAAMSVGALALGAVAVGALAIRALAIKTARIQRLEIGELVLGGQPFHAGA